MHRDPQPRDIIKRRPDLPLEIVQVVGDEDMIVSDITNLSSSYRTVIRPRNDAIALIGITSHRRGYVERESTHALPIEVAETAAVIDVTPPVGEFVIHSAYGGSGIDPESLY